MKAATLKCCKLKGARQGGAREAGHAGEPEPGHGAHAAQLHQAEVHHQGGRGLPQRTQVGPQHLHALGQRHPPEDRRRGCGKADRCKRIYVTPGLGSMLDTVSDDTVDTVNSCILSVATEDTAPYISVSKIHIPNFRVMEGLSCVFSTKQYRRKARNLVFI